jgi:hypothetical protein
VFGVFPADFVAGNELYGDVLERNRLGGLYTLGRALLPSALDRIHSFGA